ncbi:MAG: hypothetical protein KKB70_07425 [Proteobacteria bacterium]|nr:hypothetical protein [Pseudomonadota bacterium]MBU1610500.1 hypothetical protein [Pseudomonadota bacterium]
MAQEHMLREHLHTVIMDKVSSETDRRAEALSEFFAVTGTVTDTRAEKVAELVPPLLPDLYTKWVNMFLDRLFETVPLEHIELLCTGSEKDNAAAVLAYIMFLESERMEKQIAEDLSRYGMEQSGKDEMGDLAAQYIRSSMGRVAKSTNATGSTEEEKRAKAEAYKKRQAALNRKKQ